MARATFLQKNRYFEEKLRIIFDTVSISLQSCDHFVMHILEQELAPRAHPTNMNQLPKKFGSFFESEAVTRRRRAPIAKQSDHLVALVLWDGHHHGTCIGHKPKLATFVTNGVLEKFLPIRLARA
jgi:hypothetical protein